MPSADLRRGRNRNRGPATKPQVARGRHPPNPAQERLMVRREIRKTHTGRRYLVEIMPSTNGVMRQVRRPDRSGPSAR
jgi:hypothetical protein